MKSSGFLYAFQALGILAHCLLTAGLIAIGYFDFMGFSETAESSAELFRRLASHGDEVFRQMSVQTLSVASSTLSAFKMLALASLVALLAHILTVLIIWRQAKEIS